MNINTTEILNKTDIVDVVGKFVRLQEKGANWVGLCPFHKDSTPSLTVNQSKQIYKCFVCDDKAGDSIQFLMDMGYTFKEATAYLDGNNVQANGEVNWSEVKKDLVEWTQIEPPRPPISHEHHHWGLPSKVWEYHTAEGKVLGYVCRFDTDEGKQVIPQTYKQSSKGVEQWRWSGFDNPRPLYNLHYLIKYPEARFCVVEGEKCAEYLQSYYKPEKLIVTTWIGGAKAVKYTDLTPLYGRNGILWADNDEAGRSAMLEIHQQIKAFSEVKWVHIPDEPEYPEKYDCADTEWTKDGLNSFLKAQIGEVPVVEVVEEVEKPEPKFLGKHLITFKDGTDLWIKSIRPENNKLTLGFQKFDDVLKGKLRGKLIGFFGYGGAKKSLLAQFIGKENIMNNQRGVYSSMEMGLAAVMERQIDMSLDDGQPISPAYAFERGVNIENNEAEVRDVLDKIYELYYKDKLFLTDSAAMTSERYEEYIDEIELHIGKVDFLIVDGLSMMGGTGTEVELYSEHSKQLKELAKKKNILIILICHLSKGGKVTDRDPSKLIRGSEKIKDNVDGYVCLSRISIDGTEDNLEPTKGYARLVDKRGSGKIIDVTFDIKPKSANFFETDDVTMGSNFL